jgi:DNA invertase Pin-like site-specific DNA recombinase
MQQRYLKLFKASREAFEKVSSLDMPYSTDLAVNKLIATFENELRKERQRQGIAAAKKAGIYKGRKTVITKKLIAEVKDLKQTISQIVKIIGRHL